MLNFEMFKKVSGCRLKEQLVVVSTVVGAYSPSPYKSHLLRVYDYPVTSSINEF